MSFKIILTLDYTSSAKNSFYFYRGKLCKIIMKEKRHKIRKDSCRLTLLGRVCDTVDMPFKNSNGYMTI
jgi:hypothetical protein